MAIPPVAIALGAAALLLINRSASAKTSYAVAPPDGSAPPKREPPPPEKGWQEMPPQLQEQVAAALGQLGVSPATGEVTGVPTADAIKMATQTAALCESQGFYEVAKELRRLSAIAVKKVPTPPEAAPIKAAAPPGLTAAEIEAITRTLTLDRDPKSIQALIVRLEKLPPSPQRDSFIQMSQALLLQLQSAQTTTATLQQIDQVIKAPTPTAVQAATQPLPPAVIPVAKPAAPPIVLAPQPAPKPVPAASAPRLLKSGMTGLDVKAWQEQLIRDGFAIKADGVYGPATKSATAAWQKQRGLPADGIVGPATRARTGTAPIAKTPATALPGNQLAFTSTKAPAAPGKPSLDQFPDPNPSAPVIKRGSPKSDYVASFQKVLNTFGYPVGTPDGVFGPGTEKQTRAFQAWSLGYYKDSRIVPDGVVGPITRRLVRMRAAELLQQKAA
jgi:peptidoglycan hydrolase-like protein with peptidoglycan-binding domain